MTGDIELRDDNAIAINNTRMRRFLTLLALKTTSRFYKWHGLCVPISSRLIVKRGTDVNLTEAATMVFVAARTKIPVPRVHCSFTRGKVTYIVMERMRGRTLPAAWSELSEADIERVLLQLRSMLEELRSVPAPGTAIESCIGGPLYDCRIPQRPRFGPFPCTRAFHEWLREGLGAEEKSPYVDDEEWTDLKYMIAMQNQEWETPVFTHSDLNPSNIMVRDGNIEAIIDWECSGWYPRYWEYTSVWLGNKTRLAWQGMAEKFIDPWPNELRMEAIRQKWWGDF